MLYVLGSDGVFVFCCFFFFFNDTATTEIYTLSLHDALPIYIDGDPLIIGVQAKKANCHTSPVAKDDRSKNDTTDRKSTRLNSSHMSESRMPSSA